MSVALDSRVRVWWNPPLNLPLDETSQAPPSAATIVWTIAGQPRPGEPGSKVQTGRTTSADAVKQVTINR